MTTQAINILRNWHPKIPGGVEYDDTPPDLVSRYKRLICFLGSLPPDAAGGRILRESAEQVEVEVVRCTRCLSSVSTDKFCHGCNRFLWGNDGMETLRWGDVPSTEGLLNPFTAYPVPLKHAASATDLAVWLATCDEMTRLEMRGTADPLEAR